MHALFGAFISSLLLEHALFLLVLARSDHGIPDGGLQVWLHGRMLCYASCVLCLEAPQRAQGLLASKTKKAYLAYIFSSRSEGRNAVAIFGKRESPQLRIFFAAAGTVDVSSSEYIY